MVLHRMLAEYHYEAEHLFEISKVILWDCIRITIVILYVVVFYMNTWKPKQFIHTFYEEYECLKMVCFTRHNYIANGML